jgi:hypothetical protein
MKTSPKVLFLLISTLCLSCCVGNAEWQVTAKRNIRWFSEVKKFEFTLEHDQVEDKTISLNFGRDVGLLRQNLVK